VRILEQLVDPLFPGGCDDRGGEIDVGDAGLVQDSKVGTAN